MTVQSFPREPISKKKNISLLRTETMMNDASRKRLHAQELNQQTGTNTTNTEKYNYYK